MSATLSAGVNSLILKLDTPYDTIRTSDVRDDLIKVKVWCSATSGFTPSDSNKVFDALSLSIVIPKLTDGTALAAGTAYYVKYAFISDIDETVYTISSQLTATPVAALSKKASLAYLYQWSTSQPGNPSGSATYTWATGASSSYTGGNSWSTTIGSNPGTALLQLWTATKAVTDNGDATTTSVDWSTGYSVASISQNGAFGATGGSGAPGVSSARAILYKPALTMPGAPTGTSTYTWATSSFSYGGGGDWSTSPPTSSSGLEGQTLWAAVVNLTDTASSTSTTINWTTAAIVAQSYYGITGPTGPASTALGPTGSQGISARTAYAVTTTTPSSTPSNLSVLGDTVPTTGTWFTGVTWLSNAPASLSEGQFLYQVDGLYNPATGYTNWIGIPYLSSLKVGNLQAISANTGDLNVTGTIKVYGNTTNGILIDSTGISIYNDSKLRVKLGSI